MFSLTTTCMYIFWSFFYARLLIKCFPYTITMMSCYVLGVVFKRVKKKGEKKEKKVSPTVYTVINLFTELEM